MRKLIICIVVGVMTLMLACGCGTDVEETSRETFAHYEVENIEVEDIQIEDIDVEDIQIDGCLDEEYIREVEYNSRQNVYHGDWQVGTGK